MEERTVLGTHLLTDASQQTINNPFARLFAHDMRVAQLPSGKEEAIRSTLVAAAAVGGAWNYKDLAHQYAEQPDALLPEFLQQGPHTQIGVLVTSAGLLWVIGNDYFVTLADQKIPTELQDILARSQSVNGQRRETALKWIVSALSSVVLSVTYAANAEHDSQTKKILLSIVIAFDNTVLHLIPTELIINTGLPYNAPLVPLMKFFDTIQDSRRSQPQKNAHRRRQVLQQEAEKILQLLQNRIAQAAAELDRQARKPFTLHDVLTGIEIDDETIKTMKLIRGINVDGEEEVSAEKALITLLEHVPSTPPSPPPGGEVLHKVVWAGYTIWLNQAVLGYFASAVKFLANKTSLGWGFGLTGVPNYLFAVILTFFANGFAREDISFIHGLLHGEITLPLMGKIAPLPYLMMFLSEVYCLLTCHAAGEQAMINSLPRDKFDSDTWRDYFDTEKFIIASGIIYTSFRIMLMINHFVLTKAATHLGGDKLRELMNFAARTKRVLAKVMLIKPEVLRQAYDDTEMISDEDWKATFDETRQQSSDAYPNLFTRVSKEDIQRTFEDVRAGKELAPIEALPVTIPDRKEPGSCNCSIM